MTHNMPVELSVDSLTLGGDTHTNELNYGARAQVLNGVVALSQVWFLLFVGAAPELYDLISYT